MKTYIKGGSIVTINKLGEVVRAEYAGTASERKQTVLKLFIDSILNGDDVSEYEVK